MYTYVSNFRSPVASVFRGALLLAALVVLAPQSLAQQQSSPASPQANSSQLMQQIMMKRAEIQQISQELQQIQESTMEANPGLAEQRDELVALVDSKMVEAGHDPDASREKIEDLQAQLKDSELSDTERQQLDQALRQEVGRMQQSQSMAMQQEDVSSQRDSLNEDLLAAMEEQNPETPELISQLQSAQQEYRQLVGQARQMQQGTMPAPGS